MLRSENVIKKRLKELKDIEKENNMDEIDANEALRLEQEIETLEWVLRKNSGRTWL